MEQRLFTSQGHRLEANQYRFYLEWNNTINKNIGFMWGTNSCCKYHCLIMAGLPSKCIQNFILFPNYLLPNKIAVETDAAMAMIKTSDLKYWWKV